MNGVLIYTASGDSEGSYGGLIRQCEPFLLENNVKKLLILHYGVHMTLFALRMINKALMELI